MIDSVYYLLKFTSSTVTVIIRNQHFFQVDILEKQIKTGSVLG